jgi:uncharacterized membrane protein (UPF0127 family)
MLFVFGQPAPWAFTMEHAIVPLDMIFVDGWGIVVDVIEHATPRTAGPYTPRALAAFVLEMAGGQAKALGIVPGARINAAGA